MSKPYLILKKILDFVISLAAVFILSPFLIIVSILIRIETKGSVLFIQKRIGIDKKNFNIIKFRTMHKDTPKDIPTHMLENPEKYITGIGNFLRKTSLDELPQIVNILMGDMSLVGPRPALWNQDDLVAERDKYGVNKIKPGLTGWAQINGRDELPIEVKAKLDGEYKEKMSFSFDLKIILKTLICILKKDGICEGGIDRTKD